jgi:integrase
MSILEFKTTRKEWLKQSYAKAHNTGKLRESTIKHWDKFLASINHNDEAVLMELRKNFNNPDAYVFLNRYVQYLIEKKLRRASIVSSFSTLRSWCSANGIMLHNEFVKQFVKFPKDVKEIRHPLTPEIIQRLIDNSPTIVKSVLLCLLSSGMRVSECLALKVEDINQDVNPIELRLRAQNTKTKEERIAYISSEAWMNVNNLIKNKGPDDYVFYDDKTRYPLESFEIRFARVRVKAELIQKYDSGLYKVNIHAFRAYFHTQATKTLGGDTAHALLGHHAYLDQYFRLSNDEKSEMYHKLEPFLTVDNTQRQKAIIEDKDKQLKEVEILKEEMKKMQAQIQRANDKK